MAESLDPVRPHADGTTDFTIHTTRLVVTDPDREIEASASYVHGWLEALAQDKRLLVTAGAQAKKAWTSSATPSLTRRTRGEVGLAAPSQGGTRFRS